MQYPNIAKHIPARGGIVLYGTKYLTLQMSCGSLYVGGSGVKSQVLKVIRASSGLDQATFAEAIGADQPMVSRFESGERSIPAHYEQRIAKVARTDADKDALLKALELAL